MVSIIVAIYNIENHIRQCIETVLAQSYCDFELILVEDGSPDNCAFICDEYANKDSRIKVLHKKNAGVVKAREDGLKMARGEYVLFIDGDDFMESDYVQNLVDSAYGMYLTDIVIAGYVEDNGREIVPRDNYISSGKYDSSNIGALKKCAIYDGVFYRPGIWANYWNKLFRREFLNGLIIEVDSSTRMGEDAAFVYPAIACASNIVVNNEIKMYHYRTEIAEGSMSKGSDEEYFSRIKILLDNLRLNFNRYNNSEMLDSLDYYLLFVLQIGFEQNIMNKNLIKEACENFDISTVYGRVNREGFSKGEKIWFFLLTHKLYGVYVGLKRVRMKKY